jgi:ATP-dependent helicase Lhr and Lhr-like helicase
MNSLENNHIMNNPFTRLAPFIQEYIYRQNWGEFRDIQLEACNILFNDNRNLLLAAETASGKTEAAFLPILTMLLENPSSTIGVLYISPTKALINDQFYRLNDLLEETGLPVYCWHGDIAQNTKEKLLAEKKGILQITPESLESLLLNHTKAIPGLFKDLRFIIIDEVHMFMNTDRGKQILCQLERISRLTGNNLARRIGLSATLGDYRQAEEWLSSGSNRRTVTPKVQGSGKNIRLAIEEAGSEDYYEYIYKNTVNKKSIVFANNRGETENINLHLKEIAASKNKPDVYYVHHGSISKTLREAAETAMKDPYTPSVVSATVTLELGIDIGQLDRIVQINAPLSVSSFLQRLGRSGRRNNPSEMVIVCVEDLAKDETSPIELLPWQLLQSIAVIQLYLEDKWIEPVRQINYPLSLLYHQTMSILANYGELSPAKLAQEVLTLSQFRKISKDDYKMMLLHLLETDHLEKTEQGNLIIGLRGEREVNNFKFYAVFADREEYSVKAKNKEIGKINIQFEEGDIFTLAGKTWEVVEIDSTKKIVFVKPSNEISNIKWPGSSVEIHPKIVRKIREILLGDAEYSYLQQNAKVKLEEARETAKNLCLSENYIIESESGYYILPWTGSAKFELIKSGLMYIYRNHPGKIGIRAVNPYFMKISNFGGNIDIEKGMALFEDLKPEMFIRDSKKLRETGKFNKYLPEELLEKAYIEDYIKPEMGFRD